MPSWLKQHFMPVLDVRRGLELFSGSGHLTTCCRAEKIYMYDPFDILHGAQYDVFAERIDRWIEYGLVSFLWMGPPCKSFSALRNLDSGGPLRPKGHPEGNEENAEVKTGNLLRRRALKLAKLAYLNNVPFCIEHPASSSAWHMSDTLAISQLPGVIKHRVDWCGFGAPTMKPTCLLSTMPWLSDCVRRCPGVSLEHSHAKALRGKAATEAAAYTIAFCQLFSRSYLKWAAARVAK